MHLSNGESDITVHTGKSSRILSVDFIYDGLMSFVSRANGNHGYLDLLREAWNRYDVPLKEADEIIDLLINNKAIEQKDYPKQPFKRYHILNYSPAKPDGRFKRII